MYKANHHKKTRPMHMAPAGWARGVLVIYSLAYPRVVKASFISPRQAGSSMVAGLDLLGKIGRSFGVDQDRPVESAMEIASRIIEKDENDRPYLKIPMPAAETDQKVLGFISQFTGKK